MKAIMNQFAGRVYTFFHANGFLADMLYGGMFHYQKVARRFHYFRVLRQKITPDEIWEQRGMDYSEGLNVGVTNICNAKCTFCAYPKVVANKTLQTGVMSFEVFKRAIDEMSALGKSTVDLTPVVGDPLVDAGLLEKLDYAIKKGMKKVHFTTNGILLDKNDNYRRLVDSGITNLYISTSGTNKETYDQVYGVERYNEFLSGVHHLLEYNRSKQEPVGIVIRFRNADKPSQILQSPDFIKYIKPFISPQVRVNFTVDFDNWGGTILPADMKGTMPLRQLPPQINVPCKALFGFAVRHDGRVRLCGCRLLKSDVDDLVVGNILEASLLEISKSEKSWEIIKGFYTGKRPEACRDCTIYAPIDRKWLQARTQNFAKSPDES